MLLWNVDGIKVVMRDGDVRNDTAKDVDGQSSDEATCCSSGTLTELTTTLIVSGTEY